MASFLKAMTTGAYNSVPLAASAEVRENAKLTTLRDTAWKRVKTIKSVMTFADPLTGNVVSRAGVELVNGTPGYISTRLKVAPGGRVTDVELGASICGAVERT
jgi:hypothetical protein